MSLPRLTICHAPHPDDEFLYNGAYLANAAARGDRLMLVAWTDGGSSGARPDGWTVAELCAIRRTEQTSSWRNLTGLGSSTITRMGCVDSQDTGLRQKVTAKAIELQNAFQGSYAVEHYAACNNGMGQGVDHDAVALGLRDAGLPVARFANRCTDAKGTVYKPADQAALDLVSLADSSYSAFGHTSVASFFQAYRDSGYTNRIVP